MRILVIGKEGQLAMSLAAARRSDGLELVAVGRPELDLTEPDTICRSLKRYGPNLVINTAAYTAVDKAEFEPTIAYATNAAGAAHVAQRCAERAIPLIQISTDYVFDGRKLTPYSEDDATAPLGVYGHTKLEGEQRVAEICSMHIILRTAWIVSPFGHNFVKTMLRLAKDRAEIGVVHDQRGNPTFAPHLAVAILAIAHRLIQEPGRVPWGIYHASGRGEATWCEVAREIFRVSAKLAGPVASVRPIGSADYPTSARRPANSRLDCNKLARAFDVCLPDWRVGVEECVLQLSQGGKMACSPDTG